ncbi:hypothetical protein [Conexibacter woesei]|uniref:Uncharacterized protein n=1 Tax=Conexibacter woesei (strain DSM 14684 / CCUG 47730 / CIP 108061 / JCM 11494 / NBRC 100937 / ID131577) TaxID=469383 RepID=D3EZ69_CONWI|nr:hypothetical protein [Conexibacter woesei]ADB51834.1 hypothetical protein Cwoe_3416 [Conexibacter woesei DSM 14684]
MADDSPILLGDEVQKAHPSLRLFLMHPDLGLREMDDEIVVEPDARELSVGWLALPVAEQRLRKRDMRRALLDLAAAREDARFGPLLVEPGGGFVLVWLDPWKRDALQGELMRAWWEPAQERPLPVARGRRRVSRETRARIHRAWEAYGWRATAIVAIGVFTWLMSDTWHSAAVVLVVALTIAATIGDALKLWYEGSDES